MIVGLIFARAANGVIGRDNAMPWHLPEDLARLKALTLGHPVLMGRKTWDSLPERFRPLPGRRNIVISRQSDWQASGAERAASLDEALRLCAGAPEVWVLGGAQIYAQAMPLAQRAEVTEIHAEFEGDAHAPQFGSDWAVVQRVDHVSRNGLPYSFVTLERRSPTP